MISPPLFCYPNWIDAATGSGGSWEPTAPLTYCQRRSPAEQAQSTDADLSSTTQTWDYGSNVSTRVLSLHGHNLSLNAQVKFRLRQSGAGSDVYDSGWLDVFPDIYPTGATIQGQSVASGTVTDQMWATGKRWDPIHVLSSVVSARYLYIDISDEYNDDGRVRVGRPFWGPAYEPATAKILQGAKFDMPDLSTVDEMDGGAIVPYERFKRRRWDFDLGYMDDIESKTEVLEMKRQLGNTGQFLFVADPSDDLTLNEQSFLARFDSTSPAAVAARFLYRQPLSLEEDL